MKYQGTLTERLLCIHEELPMDKAVSKSILKHVLDILNTNKGSTRSIPDYGIDLINDCNKSQYDVAQSISRDIEYQVKKYDPRVDYVRVIYNQEKTDSTGVLSFFLEGKAIIDDRVIDFYTDFETKAKY